MSTITLTTNTSGKNTPSQSNGAIRDIASKESNSFMNQKTAADLDKVTIGEDERANKRHSIVAYDANAERVVTRVTGPTGDVILQLPNDPVGE